jgi:hypothetical protein
MNRDETLGVAAANNVRLIKTTAVNAHAPRASATGEAQSPWRPASSRWCHRRGQRHRSCLPRATPGRDLSAFPPAGASHRGLQISIAACFAHFPVQDAGNPGEPSDFNW